MLLKYDFRIEKKILKYLITLIQKEKYALFHKSFNVFLTAKAINAHLGKFIGVYFF